MSSILDVVAAQLEVVGPQVENYVATTTVLGDLVKKAEKTSQISRYLYRKVIKNYMGGVSAKYSGDGGAFPAGSGMNVISITSAYFYNMRSYTITDEEVDTTSSAGQSRINVMAEQVADAMIGAGQDEDIQLHTNGNGVLTNSASASADSTHLTFNGTTDTLKTNLIREGMSVDVWDTTLATKRANGPYQITQVDKTSQTVTFGTAPTGLAATDRLVWPLIDAYGPSTPTSFSSTFPLTGVAAGIGGDSFRHGYKYCNAVTTTDYFYGKLKSAYPQFISNRVNAASNLISWSHGRLGIDAVLERYQDAAAVARLVGFAHPAQIKSIEDLNVQLNTIMVTNGQDVTRVSDRAAFDRNLGTSTQYCSLAVYKDARQNRDRVDFISTDHIERTQLFPTGFQEGGDGTGRYLFRNRNSSGRPVASQDFFVRSAFDWLWTKPGANFYIDSLTVPPGY